MNSFSRSTAWVLAAFGLGLAGCAQYGRTPVYTGKTGTAVAVPVSQVRGRVVSVNDVMIRDTPAPTSNTGSTLSTAAGVLTGSVTAIARAVGDGIEGSKRGRPGEEITVALDNGNLVTIVQDRSSPPFAPDERVMIVKRSTPGGTTIGDQVVRDEQVDDGVVGRRGRFSNFAP